MVVSPGMSTMKITVVSMHTSPWTQLGAGDGGGMNVVVRHQSEQLGRMGHHVEVVTRRTDPQTPTRQPMAPGVELITLDAGPAKSLPKSQIDLHLAQFGDGLAQLGAGDVVHSHHWMSGVAALPIARSWGVPHLMSYHSIAAPQLDAELSAGEPPESPQRVPGELACARGSDGIVAVSRAEAQTVVDRFGASQDRISVVHPGVDHGLFHPLAQGSPGGGGPWDGPYLLFAARLQPLKGADLVVEALGLMDPATRPGLIIAGEVSEDFAAYRGVIDEIVERYGLEDRVVYTGAQPRPVFASLMRHAKLTLVPSHSETFGLVALESAASGVPVVAAAAGGLLEAVAEGRSGHLVPGRDPHRWAEVITGVLTDRQRLAALGRSAEVWSRQFSWIASAQRLELVLRAAVAAH